MALHRTYTETHTEHRLVEETDGDDFLGLQCLCAHFVKLGLTHTFLKDRAEDSGQPRQLSSTGLGDLLWEVFKDDHYAMLSS